MWWPVCPWRQTSRHLADIAARSIRISWPEGLLPEVQRGSFGRKLDHELGIHLPFVPHRLPVRQAEDRLGQEDLSLDVAVPGGVVEQLKDLALRLALPTLISLPVFGIFV